jgi:hypothetical protein
VAGLLINQIKMKETEKQLEYIRFIEEETGIIYKGQTKQEASKYISENKDKVPASASINMWALVKGY